MYVCMYREDDVLGSLWLYFVLFSFNVPRSKKVNVSLHEDVLPAPATA